MKLRHSLPAAAFILGACATIPDAYNDEKIKKEEIITCEPGDLEVVHLRQVHRTDNDRLLEYFITRSQFNIYNYLTALADSTGSKVLVLVEGVTEQDKPADYLEKYELGSARGRVRKKVYALYDESRSYLDKVNRDFMGLNLFKKSVGDCLLSERSYEDCLVFFEEKPVAVSKYFLELFPNQSDWSADVSSWLKIEKFVLDQRDRLRQPLLDNETEASLILEEEVKRNPYWGGGALRCWLEDNCEILPGEKKELHLRSHEIEVEFGKGSPEYLSIHEDRDNEIFNIISRSVPADQSQIYVSLGGKHDLVSNAKNQNELYPERRSVCLSEVLTYSKIAKRVRI